MKTDRLTIQMVVLLIGSACLLSIGGLIALSLLGRQAPESLTTLAGAAIGALGSLLARTSTEPSHQDSSDNPPGPLVLTASPLGASAGKNEERPQEGD